MVEKHVSFHHHYHPFCQGAVSRTSRFTWEAMAFSQNFPRDSALKPRHHCQGSRHRLASQQCGAWFCPAAAPEAGRCPPVETCGSCKSKNGPKLSLTTKRLGHKYAWMEWTMNEPIHFWVFEISWSMLAVPHSTKLPMILHWRHNSEVTNFEIWKSGKDQVLKSWDIWLFQINPNSDSVHPILRNNKLPSCQVPNYQRVGPQFQQMLLISHQGQKPKSSDLAAQRFQIGIHGMHAANLQTCHTTVTLPWSLSSPFVSRPWDMGKSKVIKKWLHCFQGNPRSWHPARRATQFPHLGRKNLHL